MPLSTTIDKMINVTVRAETKRRGIFASPQNGLQSTAATNHELILLILSQSHLKCPENAIKSVKRVKNPKRAWEKWKSINKYQRFVNKKQGKKKKSNKCRVWETRKRREQRGEKRGNRVENPRKVENAKEPR